MFFIILFTIITFATIFAIIRSGKSLREITTDIKFEIIYQVLGGRSVIEDLALKHKNVTDLPNRTGQFAVVTGGARGIGTEIVKMLMQCNMHVIIGCRNVSAGEKLETLIRKQGIKSGELRCYQLDTSSNKSVKEFASKIKEKYPKIHILINNAGIMFGPHVLTEDGIESQFAVNYLGHYLLTHLLIPQLKAAGTESNHARIVNVTSCAHFACNINFSDINFKEQYNPSQAYTQSKLAQVMFTVYLQNQLAAAKIPIEVFSVHPGVVNTDLFNQTPLKKMFPWLPEFLFKSPIKGATPIVYAALSPKLEGKGGNYITNCKITSYSPYAKSLESQEKLFEISKKLLNINEFGVA